MSEMFSKNAKELHRVFTKYGFHIRLVGGSVRDVLLNIQPNDYDFCTDAFPEEMIEIFKKENIHYIPTGLKHGTISVLINKELFEITTLRTDVETNGRHATVQYIRDFKHDAERRDFTINAMSMDFDGKIYDYFGGQKDIEDKIIKFVGDPELRIKEDYLRILRYFRFFARYGWNIVNNHEIKKLKSGLQQISGERIWLEISKILVSKYMVGALTYLHETEVDIEIDLFYEIDKLYLAETIRNRTNNPITILSLLVSKEVFERIIERYKLSNEEKNLGFFLINNKDIKHNEKSLKDLLVENKNSEMIYELSKIFDINLKNWHIPVFPVSGNDIMKILNIKTGIEVGEKLRILKDKWKESNYTLTRNELLS